MRALRLAAPVAVTAAVLAGTVGGPTGPDPAAGASPRLQPFGSCDELVDWAKEQADRIAPRTGTALPQAGAPAPVEQDAAGEGGADDVSRTNVQERGVDEPDIVKTNDTTLFAIAGGRLRAVDLGPGAPRVVGSLGLDRGGEMLLHGNRLLVLSSAYEAIPIEARSSLAPVSRSSARLTEVDVSNPAAMRVVRTLTVDGNYVAARLTGTTARVVVSSSPLALSYSPSIGRPGTELPPDQQQQDPVDRSRPESWLPSYVLQERGGARRAGLLVGCTDVRRPAEFSGLDVMSVVTVDLSRGLAPADSDGLMTDADTVYASPTGLYAATERFIAPDERQSGPASTTIHKFDASVSGRTEYRASGQVAGTLLNQFSMSEHRGHLRAATTVNPGGSTPASQSFVSVLAERAGELVQVGRVGNLGRGERIYSVRFIADTGYVVTFRQVDPLYTIDLSVPSRPRTVGELKIRGYSAYLHPVGGDRLLGVGQDASLEGRVLGTQLSLFDVSNLARPVRLDQVRIGPLSSSEVEYDHHAFLYWPASRLMVMPLQVSAPVPEAGTAPAGFTGAVGFRLAGSSLSEAGRITHSDSQYGDRIRRTVVAGDRLLTVSDRGVGVNSLDTLAPRGFVRFS